MHLRRRKAGIPVQHGFSYGRIDLVASIRDDGDSVSPAEAMSHPVLMAIGMLNAAIAAGTCDANGRSCVATVRTVAVTLVAGLRSSG